MARVLVAAALLVVAAIGCSSTAATTRPDVSLTITYWPDGPDGATVKRWTLRCDPLGGTLPRRLTACRKLRRLGVRVFAPVPRDAVCTLIYGGPQVARVRGRFDDRAVLATFNRTDGCQIARWQRVTPWLLPAGSGA